MAGYNHLKLKYLYDEYRRNNRKVTKMDIVDSIGISKSSLENYIAGVSVPSAEIVYKICIFFGVRVDQVYDYPEKLAPKNYPEIPKANMSLNENVPDFTNDSEGWKTAFETQKELMEARVEIERLKKNCVCEKTAHAG